MGTHLSSRRGYFFSLRFCILFLAHVIESILLETWNLGFGDVGVGIALFITLIIATRLQHHFPFFILEREGGRCMTFLALAW